MTEDSQTSLDDFHLSFGNAKLATQEDCRRKNAEGVQMICISKPQPTLYYELLSPELQIKYNGTNAALAIIKYEELRIYKHLVPENGTNFVNACVLDIDRKLSQEELYALAEVDLQEKYGLFLLVQDYGLDIFKPRHADISNQEFKKRCMSLAQRLSLSHNMSVRVVFAQTLFPTIIDLTPEFKG